MANISPNSENAIVTIHVTGNKKTVSAKELYDKLGLNKSHWSKWYPRNIQDNEFFTEYVDWEGFALLANGNVSQDFEITLDFAKHIAMMARTENGHKIRNQFIEYEQKSLHPKEELTEEQLLAKAYLIAIKKTDELALENKELKQIVSQTQPKADTYDRIFEERTYEVSLTEVAELHDISAKRLVDVLIERGIFKKDRKPHLRFLTTDKWFHIIDGENTYGHKYKQVMVTPAGQKAIPLLLNDSVNHPLFPSASQGQQKRLIR